MDQRVSFGHRLRQRRQGLDLTQLDLAVRAGCSHNTIDKIEHGERLPSRQLLEQLVHALDIPDDERGEFMRLAGDLEADAPSMGNARLPLRDIDELPSSNHFARAVRTNLPLQHTPLIGREREVQAVCELLRRQGVRLLTLVGPPGIGKTRLSVQVASDMLPELRDGVCFVPLSPVSDAELVLPSIAHALELRSGENEPVLESLKRFLQGKRMLLLLDNFEQVVTAASYVADLLAACPTLQVLVTSRELLLIYGEHDYPVPPLALPDPSRLPDLQTLSDYEAISLFLQRAQAVSPSFRLTERNAPHVAGICLRLEGLPLAIELAAARIMVLPPEELLARLNNRLKLLKGGARNLPDRQRSLQAAIDWSFNLLDPPEQDLFRRLGVFVGGATLQAIEEVCANSEPEEPGIDPLDGVTSLLGKSLLQRQEGTEGEARFTMLEMIREYARERLREAAELDLTGERHFDYFLRLAEAAEQGMTGSEQLLWMKRLDAEQNNIRAALEWCLSGEGKAEKGLRLVGALSRYWQFRGYSSEGRQWCLQLLSRTELAQPSIVRARGLATLGRMTFEQGDFAEAGEIYQKSLEMSSALGDDRGVELALSGLGSVALWNGEYDLCRSLYEQCLAIGRKLGAKHIIAGTLSMIGVTYMRKEEYQSAQQPLAEALAIDREMGNSAGIAEVLVRQGSVSYHLGDYEKANALIEESLGMARELGVDWIITISLARLGTIALRQGDVPQAERYLLEGLSRVPQSGNRRWSRWYLVGLAGVARQRGNVKRAAKLIGASEGVASARGAHYEPGINAEINRIVAGVRAVLNEESYERLLAEGRAMLLDEVLAYAHEPLYEGAPERGHAPVGSSTESTTREQQQTYPDKLSQREVEVLRLLAAGKSNQEIAHELVLSCRTVERHIANIYQKIGAAGKVARATAVAYALRQGLTV